MQIESIQMYSIPSFKVKMTASERVLGNSLSDRNLCLSLTFDRKVFQSAVPLPQQ